MTWVHVALIAGGALMAYLAGRTRLCSRTPSILLESLSWIAVVTGAIGATAPYVGITLPSMIFAAILVGAAATAVMMLFVHIGEKSSPLMFKWPS